MKWINDMKLNTKNWANFISGLNLSTSDEVKDTVMLTDCFSLYLQNVAIEKADPVDVPGDKKAPESYTVNMQEQKHATETFRGLIPLKQV